jgi:alanine-synthesizing transaminase
MLIISFPHNPTAAVVEPHFFKDVVKFAKKYKLIVVHDFAYADIVFDGYRAPSFLETSGAKEVGVEFISLSKSYNMAGWRLGFAVGNQKIIDALVKMKSYTDYGVFAPIQVAGIAALDSEDRIMQEIAATYQTRRDVLVNGLNRIGWQVPCPQASMYVWAPIPPQYKRLGSMEFALKLLREAEVTVSPGVGFGIYGNDFVRIALVENEHRIRQAVKNISKLFKQDGHSGPVKRKKKIDVNRKR